ncbi:MAG: O-methyltransferase [Bacteroidales bacterium]|nr:O-methyltransferase [Bacteroidales bacterium]MDZ4204686.1 O-methyltransferase [Bacteroidales bacterium]
MDNPNSVSNSYILAHTSLESEVLQKLHRETWAKVYAPQMIASHLQGSLLRMISYMIRPQRVLEVGTFTGYSAICLAAGLAEGGKLHTIEINRELEEIAVRYITEAGLENSIVRHYGEARNIIPALDCLFDLVYIDACKEQYIDFYELIIPKLRSGDFILADNALWYGKVSDPSVVNEKDTDAIRSFNNHVQRDARTENMILPFEDGIMLIRKK